VFGSNRSQSSHERTAQERERDREERERRRGQRGAGSPESAAEPVQAESAAVVEPVPAEAISGQIVPESSIGVESAAIEGPAPTHPIREQSVEPGVEPEPDVGPYLPPLADELPPAYESAAAEMPIEDWADPLAEAIPPIPGGATAPVDPPAVVEEPPAAELAVEGAAIDLDPVEIPLPVKLPPPVSAPERLPPLPSGKGRRGKRSDPLLESRASRMRAHRSSERKAGGPITRARVGATLALVLLVAVVWFLLSLFQPFTGSGHGSVIVEIPKGSGSSQVGTILAREGVVSSGFFFEARALLEGKRGDLHSGRFRMRRDMSYSSAISLLSKPAPKVIAVRVVIPEGETRLQIAEIAHANGLDGSYLVAAARSARLKPTHYGAPQSTPNLEGFLFPATYEMHAGAPAGLLVQEQLAAFRTHFGRAQIDAARALGITPYQLLTVASMIEREAEVARDRPLISAVIYNRLRLGMTLGIDATIRYALHDFSAPLTEAQLQLNSPYNTRLHTGLPPTPISNPGAASIQAATHPAHVSYLYYVAAADGCPEQVFSTSYAQFQKNAAAYQSAIAKNHGRVPTCKK
jgi:UPF0755 protein